MVRIGSDITRQHGMRKRLTLSTISFHGTTMLMFFLLTNLSVQALVSFKNCLICAQTHMIFQSTFTIFWKIFTQSIQLSEKGSYTWLANHLLVTIFQLLQIISTWRRISRSQVLLSGTVWLTLFISTPPTQHLLKKMELSRWAIPWFWNLCTQSVNLLLLLKYLLSEQKFVPLWGSQ